MIAGGLAALALALGFVTLAMNQTASRAAVHTVLTLKARRAAAEHGSTTTAKPKHVKPKPVDQNFLAARDAGLPFSVATGLARSPVVVVELTSLQDPVAKLAYGEARAGAIAAGAYFVGEDVDKDGGDIEVLTRLIGDLPVAPAALIYVRPSTLSITLPGFNDRTTVHQAIADAAATVPGAESLANASDWASQADGLCGKLSGEIRATPQDVTSIARVKGYQVSFLSKLKALKPPVGQAAQLKQLSALLEKYFAEVRTMLLASAARNVPAATAAAAASNKTGAQVATLFQKLGVPSCVGVE